MTRQPLLRFGRAATLGVLLLVAVAVPAALAAKPKTSLTALEVQYMCTSCRESLELAQSPQAQSERQFLAGLIAQGLTPAEIHTQMVDQYGLAVLAKPPAHGFNLTVYILPPAILLVGVAGLLYTLPKWRARARRAAAEQPQSAPPLDHADAERVRDELARFI